MKQLSRERARELKAAIEHDLLHNAETHCPRGHTYDIVRKNGERGCRTCANAMKRMARQRRREQQLAGTQEL